MKGPQRSADRIPPGTRARVAALLLLVPLLCGFRGCSRERAAPVAAATAQPLFRDLSHQAGIDFTLGHHGRTPLNIKETLGHGVAFCDVDGDGWLDLLLVGPDRVALYRNERNGHFTDITAASGLRQEGYWHGIATGDYDNDGRPDLFLTGYRTCALYHNEGGGRFRDVTAQAGLSSRLWGASACFVDVDRDGLLDLFVTHYVQFFPDSPQFCLNSIGAKSTCGPTMYEPERPTLYRNLGHGRFKDETMLRGLGDAHGNALGVAIADYDGDGWTDIAVANDQLPGDLYHNRGKGFFQNVGVSSGTAFDVHGEAHAGMGIDWADYNGDGKLELVVTTYQHQPKSLYAQSERGLFSDVSFAAGVANPTMNNVGFGAKFFDYDNDGLPDLIIANGHAVDSIEASDRSTTYRQPTQLFHNIGNSRFVEATAAGGPDLLRPIVGRALAVGDYDNDGRVDVLISDIEGRTLLLHNEGPASAANHWLSLRLRGTHSNRDGIGAQLRVTAGGRTWSQVVSSTGSYMAASDVRAHLGLGTATEATSIEIRWPSGQRSRLSHVAADRIVTVSETDGPSSGR